VEVNNRKGTYETAPKQNSGTAAHTRASRQTGPTAHQLGSGGVST